MKPYKEKRMMAILAHPDDESYGMGGTLAKYAHQDVQVVLLCATRGEAGISGMAPREAGKIREQELNEAAKHLGIEVFFLGYLDGSLHKIDTDILAEHAATWIDLVQPQVILTFGPEGVSGHPDHVSISCAVRQAVERFFPKTALLYLAPSEATQLGCGVSSAGLKDDKPLIAIDVSDYRIEKVRAIQSHLSQQPGLTGRAEDEAEIIPCYEYFSIAQVGTRLEELPDWLNLKEALLEPAGSTKNSKKSLRDHTNSKRPDDRK